MTGAGLAAFALYLLTRTRVLAFLVSAWRRGAREQMGNVARLTGERLVPSGRTRVLLSSTFASGVESRTDDLLCVVDRELPPGTLVRGIVRHKGAGPSGRDLWTFSALYAHGEPVRWLPRDGCSPGELAAVWCEHGGEWCPQLAYEHIQATI